MYVWIIYRDDSHCSQLNKFIIIIYLTVGVRKMRINVLHMIVAGPISQYSDVIMSSMASQITGVSVVYSAFCLGADQRKYQSSASLVFVRGINVSICWRHYAVVRSSETIWLELNPKRFVSFTEMFSMDRAVLLLLRHVASVIEYENRIVLLKSMYSRLWISRWWIDSYPQHGEWVTVARFNFNLVLNQNVFGGDY